MMISGGGSGMVAGASLRSMKQRGKIYKERVDIVWRQKGKRKSEKGVRRKVEREGGRHEEQKLLSSLFIANCVPPILQSDWSGLTAYGTA